VGGGNLVLIKFLGIRSMHSYLLQNEIDIQKMRDLIQRRSQESTIIDFEETIALASVQAVTRLWQHDDRLIAFAYIDEYNNLRFETDPGYASIQVESEIVDWGIACMKKRNIETGREDTLDFSCSARHTRRIAMLENLGFVRENLRTLHYARSLDEPFVEYAFPQGFSLRCVAGEHEVESLVALHRAAFGTDNMTVEQRLAMMHAPYYERELDFVAIAPDGELSAFCSCGLEEGEQRVGYTDPIGTHPRYRRLGLGKAIVTAGLHALKDRGANKVVLGTSSENIAMQRLAEALGFVLVSESMWFTKKVA
jgi:ribosomal protein S18 acetylase RimI-like enzyme